MRLLDYYFYIMTKWQMPLLKKDLPDSKFSACLFFGAWFAWLIVICFNLCGIISPNKVSDYLVDNPYFLLVVGVIFVIALFKRYFKKVPFEKIQNYRDNMGQGKRFFLYLLFQIFLFGIPVVYFVTFRLYLYGKVAWW